MTTIYFIRHAQADSTVLDQKSRPLTNKGAQDCLLLAEKFSQEKIDAIFSSPYKRATDTVSLIAAQHNLIVNIEEELRGLRIQSNWIGNYRSFFFNYWNDFNYHYADGESFAQLQRRNIAVLQKIIDKNQDKTIIISSHSVAIAVILKIYNNDVTYEDFIVLADNEPQIVKMEIDINDCATIEFIDL